jgi:hypothetical protein
METNRPRISNMADWRYTLDWIEARRHLATPRACASFVLISTSSTAARGGHWKAFWLLPWVAFTHGRPHLIDLLAHLSIWLVPARMRSRLSVFLDSRRRHSHGEPLRPVVGSREQSHD